MAGLGGENSNKLLKRFERLTKLKGRLIFYINIRKERGVVKGVEPWPTGHSFIVIVANPLQSLDVGSTDEMLELQKLFGQDSKLLSIVFFLVVVDRVAENRIVLQIVLRRCLFLDLLLERFQRVTPIHQQFLLFFLPSDHLLILLALLRLLLLTDYLIHHIVFVLLHFVYEELQIFYIQFSGVSQIAVNYAEGVLINPD